MKDKPRYFKVRRRATSSGQWRVEYFWSPSPELRAEGWREQRLARTVPPDRAEGQAKDEARAWNDKVDAWRAETGGVDASRRHIGAGTLAELIRDYKASKEWGWLKPKTQAGYDDDLRTIEKWAGAERREAITAPMIKALWDEYDDAGKRGRANHLVRMLRVLFSWGIMTGKCSYNPARDVKTRGTGAQPLIWSEAALAHFVDVGEKIGEWAIADGLVVNGWVGQRVDDFIATPKEKHQDGVLTFVQGKTGAVVNLPVDMIETVDRRLAEIRERHNRLPIVPMLFFANPATGQGYTLRQWEEAFVRVRSVAIAGDAELGIEPMPKVWQEHLGKWIDTKLLTFKLTRQFAVTRLLEAGCTDDEAEGVSGHEDIAAVKKNYRVRTRKMAAAAFRKRLDAEGRDR